MDKQELERLIIKSVRKLLYEERAWVAAFGSFREEIKDIVDTGAFAEKIDVTVKNDEVIIEFNRKGADFILQKHEGLTDILFERLFTEVGVNVAIYMVGQEFEVTRES